MGSSLNRSFQLFFLSLALLCFFSSADLIDDVCSSTSNPSFCSSSLRSDPNSGRADLKGLGQISIRLSTDNVKKTSIQLLPQLRKGATGKLAQIYDTCLENYGDSLDSLSEASADLNNSDFLGMSLQASAATTNIDTCDEGFQGVTEPADLKTASKNAQDLISIVLAIANRLRG